MRIRCTQDELNATARNSHHPKQAAAAAQMLDLGWRVYATETRSGAMVVALVNSVGASGVLYPNGRLLRPKVGHKSVTFNWRDVFAAV